MDRATGGVDLGGEILTCADLLGGVLEHFGVDAQEELAGCRPVVL